MSWDSPINILKLKKVSQQIFTFEIEELMSGIFFLPKNDKQLIINVALYYTIAK